MEELSKGNLPSIAKSLERIATVLEQSEPEKLSIVKELVKEEKVGDNKVSHENPFIHKVEKLNESFQELVTSFANGEAQNIDFMKDYPFETFSIIDLAGSVSEWMHSIKKEYPKKES